MRVGEIFRYGMPNDPKPAVIDGLPNYFHAVNTPGASRAKLDKGINGIKPIRAVDGSRRPAILISSSPHKIGSAETPWQDTFDVDNGHIRYFGDNKRPLVDPSKALGNSILLEQRDIHDSPDVDVRRHAVPLLFFRRVPYKGRQKGQVSFQGFGLVTRAELVTQYNAKSGEYFSNYVFDFVVLGLADEAEDFSWAWISARRDPAQTLRETLKLAPTSWKGWIKEGPDSIDRYRRRVSKLMTTKTVHQMPQPGSKRARTLDAVYKFYKGGRERRFEALASTVTASFVRRTGGVYTEGWLTPASSDGGADFIGRIDVGVGFSSAKLVVLGQAKCEARTTPTSGNHIARTVARLKRGWIGAYVTTSYFSERVQREVIEDAYPILLINGDVLAEEVQHLVQEGGHSSTLSYLKAVDASYEERVAVRRPEEILL
jgi:hypothetical protein